MNGLNYKESSYNFEFPYEDDESKRILYNSRTNALALIDKERNPLCDCPLHGMEGNRFWH